MFGGSRDLSDTTEQELDAMGEFIVYCGKRRWPKPVAVNGNIIYNINIVALCQLHSLWQEDFSTDALTGNSTASSRSFAWLIIFIPRILQRQFNNDFAMESMQDILNIQRIAIENRAVTPLVNAMTSSYQTAISGDWAVVESAYHQNFPNKLLRPLNLVTNKFRLLDEYLFRHT